MSSHAHADPGFAIPPPPRKPRPVATLRLSPLWSILHPVQEASLLGSIALLAAWGAAELLLVFGP